MRKIDKWLPSLLIVAALLLSMLGGAAYAKYVMDYNAGNGTVNITANLGKVEIWEGSLTFAAPNGYTLGERKASNDSYSYILIPGYDIPKDSSVHITEKSAIGAYIFLEVHTNIQNDPNGVSYAIMDHWIRIPELTGVHGGDVYYYNAGIINGPLQDSDLYILVDNKITVSQKLKGANISTSVFMNFYASMGQADAGNSAEEVYRALFQTH